MQISEAAIDLQPQSILQSIAPDHVGVLPEVGAQYCLDLGIFDCAVSDRIDEGARIIRAHSFDFFGQVTTAIAVERNPTQKNLSGIIRIEVGEDAAFLPPASNAT